MATYVQGVDLMAKETIEGMKKLEKMVKKIGDMPQKVVGKAAREAIKPVKAEAKRGGWIDQTGNLRKGIVTKAEKTSVKGKKIYQTTMDKNMNDIFQKSTASGMTRDNKTGKSRKGVYYYPASQEYGFRHVASGKYIPGFHYLRNGLENNAKNVEKIIVSVATKELDKILRG